MKERLFLTPALLVLAGPVMAGESLPPLSGPVDSEPDVFRQIIPF